MGLDMYMTGRKFIGYGDNSKRTEDGYEIEEIVVKIGYWRKHPDLHGYIVENFGPKNDAGEAIDNCSPIELGINEINQIVEVVKAGELPTTTGFFFGASAKKEDDPESWKAEMEEDLAILGKAAAWLVELKKENGIYRTCVYRASW